MRLNPRHPPWYLVQLGWAYNLTGRHAEAITTLQEASSRHPNFITAHNVLAFSYLVGATTLFTEFSTKRGPQHHLQCWFNSHRLYSERKRRTGSGIS
jgi:hypothetical protein